MTTTEPSSETFLFGLERVPLPAAVTDRKGGILWANPLFLERISRDDVPVGRSISVYVRPLDGEQTDDMLRESDLLEPSVTVHIGGHRHSLYAQTFGVLTGIVFVPLRSAPVPVSVSSLPSRSDDRSSRLPPAGDRVVRAFLALSESLNRPMAEEALLTLFIRVYEDLFPGRLLCIKLFSRELGEFEQIYANGRLREESHSHVRLTRAAQEENGLDTPEMNAFLKANDIFVTQHYLPVFEDGIAGFDIPLYDGNSFIGILNFEYAKHEALLPMDRMTAVPIAYQMCASIRNARLIAETTVLKDYLAKVLDQAAAPMVVLNRDGAVVVVNQAMEVQTGRSRDAFLGRDFASFVSEDQRASMTALLVRVMLGEQKSRASLSFPHADGSREVELVFTVSPVLSVDRDVEGVILVGQDLSEIRSLQQQIIHTEKLATLGQVAAGVAHEVSNPLTFISVYANYLFKKLNGVIDDADVEKIRRIVDAAGRIQAFTRELVTYGRPSREKRSVLDVQSLVERALSFCEHLLDQCDVTHRVTVEPGIRQIVGIRGHLEQVFVNLITNACHAMEGKGGEIRIAAGMEGERWIVIETSDSGEGIDPEYLDAVFEPFYTTKPEGQGTGLGLSIVRNIVTEHQGEIRASSEPGKGAVFTIRLPAGT